MGDTLAVALPGGAEWAEAYGNGLAEAVLGGSNCAAEAVLGGHVAEAEPGDLVSVYLAADAQDG